jgi:hypothetical protein
MNPAPGIPSIEVGGLISFGCAELFMLLMRARELTVLIKKQIQRSPVEREQVERGLLRSVLLEAVLFVPASVILVLVIVRPLAQLLPLPGVFSTNPGSQALYGLLGILSYEFPFALVRRVVTRIALHTLQSFASIALKEDGLMIPSDAVAARKGSE